VLPATIYFSFIINFEDCPSWQREDLLQWQQAQSSPIDLTREWFDSQFGRGNWYCTIGLSTNVSVVRLNSDFTVQYPFTSADDTESYYGALCAIMDETTSPSKFRMELQGGEQGQTAC